MTDREDPSATLSDEEIETQRVGPVAVASADDTGDTGDDTGDTGDDAGDATDATDTGDDAGDATDTGD
ncbi:MAG: hypothetical protein M3N04_09195, partial [Actinomycetota bacterium]|nr:hypothetical protein [Actinomycetota bacterium]